MINFTKDTFTDTKNKNYKLALFTDPENSKRIDLRKTLNTTNEANPEYYLDYVENGKRVPHDFHHRLCPPIVDALTEVQVQGYTIRKADVNERVHRIIYADGLVDTMNQLQPNQKQIQALDKEVIPTTVPDGTKIFAELLQNCTNTEWIQLMETALDILFSGVNSTSSKKEDQIERAKAIANLMAGGEARRIDDQRTTIILMDGHGRFLYLLMKELQTISEELLNRCKFFVYDINATVTEWHKKFFPRSCTSKTLNILNMNPLELVDPNPESERNLKNILYLNFCGIGPQKNKVSLAQFLEKLSFARTYVYISFLNARRNNPLDKEGVRRKDKQGREIQSPFEMITQPYLAWLQGITKTYRSETVSAGPKQFYKFRLQPMDG